MKNNFKATESNIITVSKITDQNGDDYFKRMKAIGQRIHKNERECRFLKKTAKFLAVTTAIILIVFAITSYMRYKERRNEDEKWNQILTAAEMERYASNTAASSQANNEITNRGDKND